MSDQPKPRELRPDNPQDALDGLSMILQPGQPMTRDVLVFADRALGTLAACLKRLGELESKLASKGGKADKPKP